MNTPVTDQGKSREFPMSTDHFRRIKALAHRLTGIHLSNQKENMIYGRLARRLRQLDLNHFDQYCDLLEDPYGGEYAEFMNAITTNLTAFFRERHHFDFLQRFLLPELILRNRASKKIRIWSAGCSTGEEPYSIAMVISNFAEFRDWDVKILATDLDTNVLARASAGVYGAERGDTVPLDYRKFLQVDSARENLKMRDEVRDLVTFKPLNLLEAWPMNNAFDFIFCRNVVIYFDSATQKILFDRYADQLHQDGHLFIGHSETLHNVCDRFAGLGRTIYQRVK